MTNMIITAGVRCEVELDTRTERQFAEEVCSLWDPVDVSTNGRQLSPAATDSVDASW